MIVLTTERGEQTYTFFYFDRVILGALSVEKIQVSLKSDKLKKYLT
jgi:hypothetical protein